jgi:Leucine-rich repeat (LRR) protein
LPQLKYLSLRDLDLRDEHVAALGVCTQLESLGLDETPVTSMCLEHLRHLPRLRVLWLTNSQVDDAGVAKLASMKSLKNLHLRGTQLTKPAVEELRGKLPGIEITH